MDTQQIVEAVQEFQGSLVVTPGLGSEFPELSWGDSYFYYAPDGVMPERTQPYGTIITKNYPDDAASDLDEPDRFRVNVYVGRNRAVALLTANADPATADAFFPHPLYGAAGWVSVVNPAEKTAKFVLSLLHDAHDVAHERSSRRG